jgi:hypothetical protein
MIDKDSSVIKSPSYQHIDQLQFITGTFYSCLLRGEKNFFIVYTERQIKIPSLFRCGQQLLIRSVFCKEYKIMMMLDRIYFTVKGLKADGTVYSVYIRMCHEKYEN